MIQGYLKIAASIVELVTRPQIAFRGFTFPPLTGPIGEFINNLLLLGEKFPPLRRFRRRLFIPTDMVRPFKYSAFRGHAERLEKKILGGEIAIKKEAPMEILYTVGNNQLSLPRVSSSVSELAPLVLYLKHYVELGGILIIEEPESHLHPSAVRELAKILASLANEGVKLIITSHSDWLLSQISNLIAANKLNDVELHDKHLSRAEALAPDNVAIFLSKSTEVGVSMDKIEVSDEGIPMDEFNRIQEEIHEERLAISYAGS